MSISKRLSNHKDNKCRAKECYELAFSNPLLMVVGKQVPTKALQIPFGKQK
jgi:hypothetical protein